MRQDRPYAPRALLRKLAWLVLGYTPLPPERRRPPATRRPLRERLRWVTTAGGLGAWRIYPYGATLGIVLVIWARLTPALPPDNDGETVGWLFGLAPASAALFAGAAGFATARRTRHILPAVLVGAVTGLLGMLLASASLVLGAAVGLVTLHDMSVALALAIPIGALCADAGLLAGAVGGALALPRTAVGALRVGFGEALPLNRRDRGRRTQS
jgi:hypothetical protein